MVDGHAVFDEDGDGPHLEPAMEGAMEGALEFALEVALLLLLSSRSPYLTS